MINVKGKTVVITGTFPSLPCRTLISARLRTLGATVKGSVDKNTDMLFCGASPASAKWGRAHDLAVAVYHAGDLRRVIAQRLPPKPHYSIINGRWFKWVCAATIRHQETHGMNQVRPPELMPQGWTPAKRGRNL